MWAFFLLFERVFVLFFFCFAFRGLKQKKQTKQKVEEEKGGGEVSHNVGAPSLLPLFSFAFRLSFSKSFISFDGDLFFYDERKRQIILFSQQPYRRLQILYLSLGFGLRVRSQQPHKKVDQKVKQKDLFF